MTSELPKDGQAGTEIQITPEMIEAGLFELSGYQPDFESGREFMVRLLLAVGETSKTFRFVRSTP